MSLVSSPVSRKVTTRIACLHSLGHKDLHLCPNLSNISELDSYCISVPCCCCGNAEIVGIGLLPVLVLVLSAFALALLLWGQLAGASAAARGVFYRAQ